MMMSGALMSASRGFDEVVTVVEELQQPPAPWRVDPGWSPAWDCTSWHSVGKPCFSARPDSSFKHCASLDELTIHKHFQLDIFKGGRTEGRRNVNHARRTDKKLDICALQGM
jgi:hypothetical protein